MKVLIEKSQIEKFLSIKKIVLVGISRNPKKFGNLIFKALIERGYEVYIIHKELEKYESNVCFKSIQSLKLIPDGIVITVDKNKTLDIVKDAVEIGIKNIWIQQFSETDEVIAFLKDKNINVIVNECLFLYLEPVNSIHKVHKFFRKLFGRMPV